MPLSLVRLGHDCPLVGDVELLLAEFVLRDRFGGAMAEALPEVQVAEARPGTHPTGSTTDHSVLHGMDLRFLSMLTRYLHRL